MISNIGSKIKTTAFFILVLGVLVSLIYAQEYKSYMILIVGSIATWLSTMCIFGFGELLCYVQSINEKLDNLENKICYSQQFDYDNEDETDEN